MEPPEALALRGLLGTSAARLPTLLGEPAASRRAGRERWYVFEASGVRLRVRCAPRGLEPAGEGASRPGGRASGEGAGPDAPRVVSWTATFREGHRSLRSAASAVGLWPDCAPDARASAAGDPLIRRPLPDPGGGRPASLTAAVRNGRVVSITAFDEPPEWT